MHGSQSCIFASSRPIFSSSSALSALGGTHQTLTLTEKLVVVAFDPCHVSLEALATVAAVGDSEVVAHSIDG